MPQSNEKKEDLIADLRKAGRCVFLATEKAIAQDLSRLLNTAADTLKESRKQAFLEAAEICVTKSKGLQASFKDGCRDCAKALRKKAEE